MPLGLTNAPATFCNLMNDVFHDFINHFVVVYLDDIVVYSESLKDLVSHLKQMLARLKCVKMEKCEFSQQELIFLRHNLLHKEVKMDEKKVQVMLDWPPPSKASKLCSFLGLANHIKNLCKAIPRKLHLLIIC